jgi:phosphoserine phosphatase RsbU/P
MSYLARVLLYVSIMEMFAIEAVPARILIVDDEPENGQALRRQLREWSDARGIAVDAVVSPRDALDRLSEAEYGVVITDNRMPGMNGTDLVGYIRRHHPSTVSILLTGYTDVADMEDAVGAGAFCLLTKPWEPDRLHEEVERALEQHHRLKTEAVSTRRMDDELRMAVEFHKRLLSIDHPFNHHAIIPEWYQVPAGSSGVSGDYIDILEVRPDAYLVFLADVSGHGLRTTFVSAILKAVLLPEYVAEYGEMDSTAHLLAWLNVRVCEITRDFPDLFVAATVCLVKASSREVICSTAGNPPPAMTSDSRVTEVHADGVALGITPNVAYTETSFQMEPGDSLYLYSDGISFPYLGVNKIETDALLSILAASPREAPLREIMKVLHTRAELREVTDDISLIRLVAEG